ncbi:MULTISPECIES: hypothetical protein [Haloarcula]|nr:hypothetical protein [Halomicroarcula sp. XH51]
MTDDDGLAHQIRESLGDRPGLTAEDAVETWLDRCLAFAESLPEK